LEILYYLNLPDEYVAELEDCHSGYNVQKVLKWNSSLRSEWQFQSCATHSLVRACCL